MSEVTAGQKKAAQSENTSKGELRALAEHHVDLARLVARNPSTSEALLRQLGSHEDATVRKWVTGHPSTPTDVLISLGQQFPEQLLENPILDFLFLENPNLLNDFPVSTIRALMKRRATPESILRFGAQTSDEATQLAVVQNPSTPEDLLKSIHKKAASPKVKDAINARRQAEPNATAADALFWEEVCARVAEYGPKKAERKLFEAVCASAPAAAQSIDWLRRRELANAASIREEDLEAFGDERNPLIIDDLLARTDLPVRLILRLIPRASTESLLRLTKSKIQAPAVLRVLAENEEEEIRIAVAKHTATPASILERMSADEDWGVRQAVAKHPQTPVSTLEAFAHDRPDEMLATLVGNKNTPDRTLRLLVQSGRSFWAGETEVVQLRKRGVETPYLMKVARGALVENDNCPADVLKRLVTDKHWLVPRMVASHSNTPAGVLKRLARRANDDVRAEVAGNTNTPVAVLEQLSRDSEYEVQEPLAGNPNSPAAVLERLANDGFDCSIREGIASNPNTPAAILKRLGSDESVLVREAVSLNSNTAVATLGLLSEDDKGMVRAGVGSNPNTPESILEFLANDDDCKVRELVAEHPHTAVLVLELLAEDNEPSVRAGVCRNPNTPVALLELLLKDKHAWVRNNAAKHPSANVFFDDIMQSKTRKTGVFESFMQNPNIIPKLEPYIPDFLRLLQGKEPLFDVDHN